MAVRQLPLLQSAELNRPLLGGQLSEHPSFTVKLNPCYALKSMSITVYLYTCSLACIEFLYPDDKVERLGYAT